MTQLDTPFIDFLTDFARLSPKSQRVFLFCLSRCPHPRPYSGDIAFIALGSGVHRNTVRYALRYISRHHSLSRLVQLDRSDHKEELYAQMQEQARLAAYDSDPE